LKTLPRGGGGQGGKKTFVSVLAWRSPDKTASLFFEFSLCLSRACLGKMFVFYINGSKMPFSRTIAAVPPQR
jgi:hypothetical protein